MAKDLTALPGSTTALALVVLVASDVPALRASRVDPATTLQAE